MQRSALGWPVSMGGCVQIATMRRTLRAGITVALMASIMLICLRRGGWLMKNLLFAASLFTFGAAFASAADAQSGRFASYPAPVWSWSGFYLGVDAGYGWSNVDHSITVNGLAVTVPTSATGFTGGIYGGYNWQFNQ